jgi:GNAT superfamily N-acetyltransferase
MIHPLEPEDIPGIMNLGLQFTNSVDGLRDPPDVECIMKFFTTMYSMDMACIFGQFSEDANDYVGVIAGICAPNVFTGVLEATEMIWYVHEDYRGEGLKLVEKYEVWAKSKSAKYVSMCHMVDSMPTALERVYKRLGYHKQDIIYRKEL